MEVRTDYYKLLLLFFLLSCESSENSTVISQRENAQSFPVDTVAMATTQPEEFFVDSINIGRKTLNKVEVFKYRKADSNYVDLKFYAAQAGTWKLVQSIHFLKDGITGCDTRVSDFSNDNLNDISIVSSVAARGANEVKRLFIYDRKLGRLIEMRNSEKFPNMRYNEELNCIDAFLVYGGCSTVFLRISGDSLREFARVTAMNGVTVKEIDSTGKEKIILRDTSNKASYVRFRNYKPLKESPEY